MTELLTPSEITRYLHISLGSVMKAIHNGELSASLAEDGCRRVQLENAIEFASAKSLDSKALIRLRRRRVLVVDDDEDFQEMLVDVLSSEQRLWVKAAASLFEARQALTKFRPHFLVLDAQLPDGNGWELVEDLRRQFGSNMPDIVGISALSSATIVNEMRDCGVSDFLAKPVDPHELLERVKQSVLVPKTFE